LAGGFGREMEESSSFAKLTSVGFCDKDKEDILIKAQIT